MIENFGEKINSNGLDRNPENINRDGRPPSIRTELRNVLEANGKMTIKAKDVYKIHKNGDVTIHVGKTESIVIKLMEWAMSKKGNESLKAIKMIMEQIDGKPNQTTEIGIKKLEPIIGMTIK